MKIGRNDGGKTITTPRQYAQSAVVRRIQITKQERLPAAPDELLCPLCERIIPRGQRDAADHIVLGFTPSSKRCARKSIIARISADWCWREV